MKPIQTAIVTASAALLLAAASYAQQDSGRFEGTSDPAAEVPSSTAPVTTPEAVEGSKSPGTTEERMPKEDRSMSPSTPNRESSGEGWRPGESSPGRDYQDPNRMPSPSERTTD